MKMSLFLFDELGISCSGTKLFTWVQNLRPLRAAILSGFHAQWKINH
jgi:hypothetical protein